MYVKLCGNTDADTLRFVFNVMFLSIEVLVSPSAEELCTLVITEAFPEDSGLFKCMALNPFGTVSCSAILEVYNGELCMSNVM